MLFTLTNLSELYYHDIPLLMYKIMSINKNIASVFSNYYFVGTDCKLTTEITEHDLKTILTMKQY